MPTGSCTPQGRYCAQRYSIVSGQHPSCGSCWTAIASVLVSLCWSEKQTSAACSPCWLVYFRARQSYLFTAQIILCCCVLLAARTSERWRARKRMHGTGTTHPTQLMKSTFQTLFTVSQSRPSSSPCIPETALLCHQRAIYIRLKITRELFLASQQ